MLVKNGEAEAGKFPSRVLPAHRAIYRKHPHVQAIVMSHPVNATAFSITDSEFDSRTIPESYVFLREVGRVPHGLQYGTDDRIADHITAASPAAGSGGRNRAVTTREPVAPDVCGSSVWT